MSPPTEPGNRDSELRLLALSLSVILSGCVGQPEPTAAPGSPSAEPASASPATASTSTAVSGPVAASELRTVPAAGLPIGDYLPPLDDGRVELPIPSGWSPLPRDSDYLVRFYKGDRNGLPRIEVLVADNAYPGFETVTEQNVVGFAETVATEFESAGKKLAETVIPMKIGEAFCARYVSTVELRMTQGSVVAERQTVVVPRQGRVYTIHLVVLPNKLLPDRDAAYALCAGMK